MRCYVIHEGRASAHARLPKAVPKGALVARNEADLASSGLSAKRLAMVYNALGPATPIKTFDSRGEGVKRLWAKLEQVHDRPTPAKGIAIEVTAAAPEDESKAVGAGTRRRSAPRNRGARAGSKLAKLVGLLSRPGGASLEQLVAATQWQAHSVRGAISGTLKKRMGFAVEGKRDAKGKLLYRLTARG